MVVVFADAAGMFPPTVVLLVVGGVRGECRWEDQKQEEPVLGNGSLTHKHVKIKLRTMTGNTKTVQGQDNRTIQGQECVHYSESETFQPHEPVFNCTEQNCCSRGTLTVEDWDVT